MAMPDVPLSMACLVAVVPEFSGREPLELYLVGKSLFDTRYEDLKGISNSRLCRYQKI